MLPSPRSNSLSPSIFKGNNEPNDPSFEPPNSSHQTPHNFSARSIQYSPGAHETGDRLIGLLWLLNREPYDELCSLAIGTILDFNPALVMIHHLLNNCQTKAGSRRARLACSLASVEPLKQVWHIIGANSQTVILDTESRLGIAIILFENRLDQNLSA